MGNSKGVQERLRLADSRANSSGYVLRSIRAGMIGCSDQFSAINRYMYLQNL